MKIPPAISSALPWFLALLGGVLLPLSYPPVEWSGLVWISVAPLAWAIWFTGRGCRRPWLRAAALGYVFGLAYHGGISLWLMTLTVPGQILLTFYYAAYPAVWAVFLHAIGGGDSEEEEARWLGSFHNLGLCALGAAGWVATEWLRGVIFPAFGWDGLGVALYRNIPLIQISDITGVGGLSFLVALVNLMLPVTIRRLYLEIGRGVRRPHYDFTLTMFVVALSWTYGLRQVLTPERPSTDLRFAAVQANVPQNVRNDLASESEVLEYYKRHTQTALAMRPDLILWPETATPRPVFNDKPTWETVEAIAKSHAGDFLFGTVFLSEEGDHNSIALLTNRGQNAQIYHKIHLVPFGEYVPLRQGFPLIAWVVGSLVPDDFDPGPYPNVLQMGAKPIRIAPLICFEDTVGDLARRSALLGAQVFVVVTNDGWFLESAGSRQHLANAVFRCAENKIPMVRAANTGITCAIDHLGSIREILRDKDGRTTIEGVLFHSLPVPNNPSPTFYGKNGEVFSVACLILALVNAGLNLQKRRKMKKSACPQPPEKEISQP